MARAASRGQGFRQKFFRGRQLFFHALQLELRLASCRPMDAEFGADPDNPGIGSMDNPGIGSMDNPGIGSIIFFDVLLDEFYKLLVKFPIENSSRRKQNPSRSTSDYSILARMIQKLNSPDESHPARKTVRSQNSASMGRQLASLSSNCRA